MQTALRLTSQRSLNDNDDDDDDDDGDNGDGDGDDSQLLYFDYVVEIPFAVRTMKEATKCSGREHRKAKNRYQGSLSWLLAFDEKEMARMLPLEMSQNEL
ncbi:hypothetical protein V1478_003917 [Vespula squamosa]|uniref:Uncharacterized protein n=1 Tax=Vespula squamosa TaxID=30214 RepID=A0ABD2BNR7_VESSQ